jgi:hypothetical protein
MDPYVRWLKLRIKSQEKTAENRKRKRMEKMEGEEEQEGTESSTSGACSTQQAGSSAGHGASLSDARAHLQHVTKEILDQWVQSGMPDQWSTQPAAPSRGPGTSGDKVGCLERDRKDAGAHAIIQSLLFVPKPPAEFFKLCPAYDEDKFPCINLNQKLIDAVNALIPSEARSRPGVDTAELLAERLDALGFFDDLLALVAGGSKGDGRYRLNASHSPVARRKAWSVVIKGPFIEKKSGKLVRRMYSYGKPNSRIRSVVHATPMPPPIFNFGAHLLLAMRPFLSEVCRSSPPNHCQLLAYYDLFDSKTPKHKDDHDVRDFYDCQGTSRRFTLEEATMQSKGAMVPGSDVLIYTQGPLPMTMKFHFPPQNNRFAKREEYDWHRYMTMPLREGWLLLYRAVDDVNFFHSVDCQQKFDLPAPFPKGEHRFAFVYRWLGPDQEANFPVE